mgnify:CR=1 FL=1
MKHAVTKASAWTAAARNAAGKLPVTSTTRPSRTGMVRLPTKQNVLTIPLAVPR